MKARGAATMGVIAVATLGVAYATWQRPKETKTDSAIEVLSATKSSLQKIHYDDGMRLLEVTRTTDGDPVVWVKSGFIDGKQPVFDAGTPVAVDAGTLADGGRVDAGVVKQQMPPPPPPPPVRLVRGNERAEKLWDKFTPFEAVRALGTLPAEKLKELGVDASGRVLDVTVSGTERRYRVGSPVNGVVGTYVLDEKDNKVYLLPSSLMSDLEPSSGVLVDRRLHAFRSVDYDSFTVSIDGKEKEFVQTDAAIPQTTKVAPKDAPDKPDEFAKNWHEKVWSRLIVTDVLGKDELPTKGAPQPLLRVVYTLKGKQKGYLELARIGADVYARTEQTAGWVALHAGMDEIAAEAKKLVGAI